MKNVLQKILGLVAIVVALSPLGAAWAAPETRVDVNTASAQELADALVGVGQTRAEAIVKFREQNGRFSEAMDLLMVRGIGSKVLEDNAGRIVISD